MGQEIQRVTRMVQVAKVYPMDFLVLASRFVRHAKGKTVFPAIGITIIPPTRVFL
jgi:hypothetical protein